jgi:membrane protease YdiL (CAAX protease family)
MPSALDVAFACTFALALPALDAAWLIRHFKRRIAAGAPHARLDAYHTTIVTSWALTACALVLWARAGRSWTSLGLVPPSDWRLWVGLGLAALVGAFFIRQNLRVLRYSAARIDRLQRGAGVQERMAEADMIVPHDAREYAWFMLVSLTAGICEELLYRGFLTWLVAAYTGVVAAVAIVSILFGLAHGYQGAKGMVRVTLVGLFLSIIVLAGGWLAPAMAIHVLMDVAGAVVTFRIVQHRQAAATAAPGEEPGGARAPWRRTPAVSTQPK